MKIKSGVKKEIWHYWNLEKKFLVEVCKWEEYGRVHWNKYLYLYPGHPEFGKYLPAENRCFPETPWNWNYGITFYTEIFDQDGKIKYQKFGDDYAHIWDEENPVDSEGTRVFADAERLIETLEGENHE